MRPQTNHNTKHYFIYWTIVLISFLSNQATAQSSFPQDWIGKWSGTLEIYRGPQKMDSLPMSLHILPLEKDGTYSYTINYGLTEEGIRDYELITVDAERGFYAVDENNGIRLSSYVVGEQFISHFEVMGSYLTSTSYRSGDKLMYIITSGEIQSEYTTGDTIINGEEIPPVQSFPVRVLQSAELSRVD